MVRKPLLENAIDVLSDEVTRWSLSEYDAYPRVQLYLRFVLEHYGVSKGTIIAWVKKSKRLFGFDCDWIEARLSEEYE